MKKLSLVMILAMVLIAAFATTAMAANYDPSTGVGGAATKNTPLNSSVITKTYETVADPKPHGDYDKTPAESGYATFYLPDGVPSDTDRIHSNYKENTDACAACHFTHTAKGARLLQWESIYKTCSACHDGSLGNYTYDVFAGKIGTTSTRTFGGLFGSTVDEVYAGNNYLSGTTNETSISNHMPNGYMALSAAPGADANAELETATFDCAACHTPHGQGGNARILSPDPGKMLIGKVFAGVADRVYNVEEFASDLTLSGGIGTDGTNHWIEGYPYNKITAVIDAGTSNLAENLTFGFDSDDKLTVTGGTKLTSGYTINYAKGEVTITSPVAGHHYVVVRVPGIFVAMKITDYMDATENVDYVAKEVDTNGATDAKYEGINAYCGACHGLYNTQGNESDGTYDFVNAGDVNHGSGQYGFGTDANGNTMYRHQFGLKWTNQWSGEAEYIKFANPISADGTLGTDEIFTCLGCHFAHGTNETYWSEYITSKGGTPADFGDLSEQYGSSALKRLPNMGTCENCHNKSDGNAKDTITVSGQVYTYY